MAGLNRHERIPGSTLLFSRPKRTTGGKSFNGVESSLLQALGWHFGTLWVSLFARNSTAQLTTVSFRGSDSFPG